MRSRRIAFACCSLLAVGSRGRETAAASGGPRAGAHRAPRPARDPARLGLREGRAAGRGRLSRRSAATRCPAASRSTAPGSRSRTSTARAACAAGRCACCRTARAATSSTRVTPARSPRATARWRSSGPTRASSRSPSRSRPRRTASCRSRTSRPPPTSPGDPQTGRGRPIVFRMCASDDVIGSLLAGSRAIASALGAWRSCTRSAAATARSWRAASRRGFATPAAGRVVAEFFYLALETDFRPQLRGSGSSSPDVVFMPGSFPDATLAAVQARQVGLHATMLGGDAWSSPALFAKGAPPGDAYYVELCSPAPEFDREYAAAIGSDPPGCRAVLAYDTVRVIAAGLRQLGDLSAEDLGARLPRTRQRLRDAVARDQVDGVTGRIRFDARGNRRQGVALYAVERTPLGPRGPGARLAGGAVSGVLRSLRDLSLRRKVTLTLAVVFVASVVALLVALVPVLGEQRQRLLDQDKRLLSTLRRSYEREFIYDQLFRNRESLALHLGDARGRGGDPLDAAARRAARPRRDRRRDGHPPADRRRRVAAPRPPGVVLDRRPGRRGRSRGPGRPAAPRRPPVTREEARPAGGQPGPGQDDFREAVFGGPAGARPRRRRSPRPASRTAGCTCSRASPRSSASEAHHASTLLRRRRRSRSCSCCCC